MRTNQPKQTLSDQLRAIIDGCGMTRAELWRRSGVEQAVLSRFMKGGGIKLEMLDRLAVPLGLSLSANPPSTDDATTAKPPRSKGKR